MTAASRIRHALSGNVVTQVFDDALDGNVIAEFAVTSLIGASLIVIWSFAFVSTHALLRGSSEEGRAHNPAAAGSTPASATTSHLRPHVRVVNEQAFPGVALSAGPGSSKHSTGMAASAPPRTVDATPRRDGGLSLLLEIVESAARAHGIPPHLLAGLAEDESSWRPGAVGKNGEVGLLQLKAPVAKWCGIRDRRNPSQNAHCGARYLALQFSTFGSWELAMVAFKAGPASIPDAIPAASWAYAQRAMARAEAYR